MVRIENDNGRQRQAASRHRVPPLRRVCRQNNRETPLKRLQLSFVLLSPSIQMDQRGLPQQRRTQERMAPRKTLPIRNKCGDSINSAIRFEHLAENYCGNFFDFARDASHTYITDRGHPEDFTLDSALVDKQTETDSFNNVFAIVSQAPHTSAR
jgi:hypothetical protein